MSASVKSTINTAAATASILERAKKRLLAIGFLIERDAKQFCPVDSGRLRASISVNWTDSGMERGKTDSHAIVYENPTGYGVSEKKTKGAKAVKGTIGGDGVGPPSAQEGKFEVVVGTNVAYAPFVELGTSTMGNIPFLRAAFEKNSALLKK